MCWCVSMRYGRLIRILVHVPVALIRRTPKISGCEQSTRWTHPGHGPRTAGRSLNLRCAGSWVFRSASGCTQGRFWFWSGWPPRRSGWRGVPARRRRRTAPAGLPRRRGRPRSGPPGARSGRTTAWAYSRAAGVTGAMAVTSDRVTPNPAASMTGVQFGWWFHPSAAAAAWQRCSSSAPRGWLRKRGRAASSTTTRTPPGASARRTPDSSRAGWATWCSEDDAHTRSTGLPLHPP